jgi:hypothetical protein
VAITCNACALIIAVVDLSQERERLQAAQPQAWALVLGEKREFQRPVGIFVSTVAA